MEETTQHAFEHWMIHEQVASDRPIEIRARITEPVSTR
jgi:hypothetical protein